jgi:hypothetical protein
MPLTLEDLDRRVTALEKVADREKSVERAVSEIVCESEQRLDDRIGAAEQRFTDLLNERFDQVMAALDKLHNPPR